MNMPRLDIDARTRIISLFNRGYSVSSISHRLTEENVDVSVRAIYHLVQKYHTKGVINDLPRRKRSRILSQQMRQFIDEELRKDDELTSTRIKEMLTEKWPDIVVSTTTIKRERRQLGWVCTRPHYCQLLREVCISWARSKLNLTHQ